MRRLRQTAQVALHCLRIVLHVCVAAPSLGQVQRRSLLPLSQLCCVELVCTQFAAAAAGLVQALLPGLFLSISHTLRQLSRASIAFRFFVISLFLLHILKRSASNTEHCIFCDRPHTPLLHSLGMASPNKRCLSRPSKMTAASPHTQARRIKCFAR